MIQLQGSRGLKLAKATRSHDSQIRKFFRWLVFALAALSVGIWLVSLFVVVNNFLLGIAEIIIGLAILFLMAELHFVGYIEQVLPKVSLKNKATDSNWLQTTNLADYVSVELANVLVSSRQEAGFNFAAFVKALLEEKTTKTILARAGLVGEIDQENVDLQAPPVDRPITEVEPVIAYAATLAVEAGYPQIHLSHVLLALVEHNQAFANLVFSYKIEKPDLVASIDWFLANQRRSRRRFFWEKGKVGIYGIGRDWASGYTPTLSRFAKDIGRYLPDFNLQLEIVGYQQAIDRLESALSSTRKANVLLVGEPGVGKKTVVNGLAARIASGEVPRVLADKHVMELDTGRVLAGLSDRGALEARLIKVLNDATTAGNIILFINNFQTLLSGEEGKVGSINAAEILLPYLNSGNLQIIAATTPADFHSTIARQSAVAEQFNEVELEELGQEDTKVALRDVAIQLEAKLGVFFSTKVLRVAVENASRYFAQVPRPENAIRVIEGAATIASQRDKIVSIKNIEESISQLSKGSRWGSRGDRERKTY